MIKLEAHAGDEISRAIGRAIHHARDFRDQVGFDFNGVDVVVDSLSDAKLIYRDWMRGLNGYLGKNPTVGPHPSPELTQSEEESDAKIEAENEERWRIQSEKYEKQQREKELVLRGALGNAGQMEFSDAEGWKRCVDANQDDYGSCVVRYAEKWARLMQVRLDSGETVAECAEELSRLADDEGITGFMYGCAVQMLAKCWKHGEALRRWHNKETQIGTEGDKANESGGVLNPALLNVGRQSS